MPNTDPVKQDLDEGWGFWDATWTYFFSGYASEQDARKALALYAEALAGNQTAAFAFGAGLPYQNKAYEQQ